MSCSTSTVAVDGPAPLAAGLYEWSAGQLQLVSVLPSGVPATTAELGYFHVAANAISSDGSRVIWTKPEGELKRGHLYMRDTVKGQTLQLDAAQGVAEPTGLGVAQFQTASSDGSRVFFTDRQRLTADSIGGTDVEHPRPLRVRNRRRSRQTRVPSQRPDGRSEPRRACDVQGFVFGASEDGTSLYLVAQGDLAGNENGNGEDALAGKNNLYELHFDGSQWTTTFIARLSGEDRPGVGRQQNRRTPPT